MTTPKPIHTPGPWQCNDGVTITAQSPHGRAYIIATVNFERPRSEFVANAAVLTAAPQMLSALEYAYKRLVADNAYVGDPLISVVFSAITTAKGGDA